MESAIKRHRTPRIVDKELRLTPGENLVIWRRRLGWNQTRAAKSFKVSVFQLKLAEYDEPKKAFKYPEEVEDLTSPEKCLIYRKRAGLAQWEIAKKLKMCREWFRQIESGRKDCSELLLFWEQNQ